MFSNLRNLVSPKIIQEITYVLYHYVKLSVFIALYSMPWTIVNWVLKFSVKTYLFYALAFVFVIPNIMTMSHFFTKKEVSFKEYSLLLKENYLKKIKIAILLVLGISIFLLDSYVLIIAMEQSFLFPVLYITLMFITAACIYFLILSSRENQNWKISLKRAIFISWRYAFTSFALFIVIMMWVIMGYFAYVLNFIFGNALFLGIVSNVTSRKINTIFPL